LTEPRIEKLREQAAPGEAVNVDSLTLMELICDWDGFFLASHTE
jgi:hypothetical protein